jgi:hemolysin D
MSTLLPAAIDFQSDARKIDERRPPWVARGKLYVLVTVIIIAGHLGVSHQDRPDRRCAG